MKKHWHKVWGDRRQELVFIGAGIDQKAVTAALDACLIGDVEPLRFSMEQYARLPDPFAKWESQKKAA